MPVVADYPREHRTGYYMCTRCGPEIKEEFFNSQKGIRNVAEWEQTPSTFAWQRRREGAEPRRTTLGNLELMYPEP